MEAFPTLRRKKLVLTGLGASCLAAWFAFGWVLLAAWKHLP
jgi:hypothetical protein